MRSLAIEVDKDKLRAFCRKWKVTEFALFGSVTRPEEFRADSDVDVLVRFAGDALWTLDRWYEMRADLATLYGREVDVIVRDGLDRMRNYLRRTEILETAVRLDVA